MTNEKIELTSQHLEAIRNKYPSARDASDGEIIKAIFGWEKHFDETGKSMSLISSLAFPSFNEYLQFSKEPTK